MNLVDENRILPLPAVVLKASKVGPRKKIKQLRLVWKIKTELKFDENGNINF